MKIAIQGHPTRGKEVIQILESLGGINRMYHSGRYTKYFYYISGNDKTIAWTTVRPQHLDVFTVKEFKKEFPFKIGDIVVALADHKSYKIIALENYNNKLRYKLDNRFHYSPKALITYKEMKEERTITLTLDKAKEWYNKGGELKEVALQAYSEEELTKVELPKTWEEFCINFPMKNEECYVDACSDITVVGEYVEGRDIEMDRNVCPSKESAEAHLAMIQLEQLRDCWRQGWVQTPTDTGYRISKLLNGGYTILSVGTLKYFLAFPTEEMAREFYECFKDLIEKVGDLI